MGYYVKGKLLHDAIYSFWDRLGSKDDVKSDYMKKKTGKKYSNAREFTNYLVGWWWKIVKGAEKSKKLENKIVWRDEKEKWKIKNDIRKIAPKLFEKLVEDGKPLFSEHSFKFKYGEEIYEGRIDEIRRKNGNIVIVDYKSGNPDVGELKLTHDPQLTFYYFGLASQVKSSRLFAEKLGLEDVRSKLGERNLLEYCDALSGRVITQLTMLEGKNIQEYQSSRRSKDIEELINTIKIIKGSIMAIGMPPAEWGRKCKDCPVAHHCERLHEQEYEEGAKKLFLLSDSSLPLNIKNNSQKKPTRKERNLRFKWKK